ncbi:hypothetical protein IFM89_019405 [Coptis chinensis]|uniref:Endonuclease/exonuclease/phosphatase domain-containing protein n=1 Tax=Coptis chinensis TaxID=261450 RepID=A0A835IPW3_9MAGN|nr:hypothetical protein IFM89_019405 [Coptis chinensis]
MATKEYHHTELTQLEQQKRRKEWVPSSVTNRSNRYLLVLKPFGPNLVPRNIDFNTSPFWITFVGLKLEHQLSVVIERIAVAVGRVLEVFLPDNAPRDAYGYKARVMIVLNQSLTQGIMVQTVNHGPTWIGFEYIGLPYHNCINCFMLGYDTYKCLDQENHGDNNQMANEMMVHIEQPQVLEELDVFVHMPLPPDTATDAAQNQLEVLFGGRATVIPAEGANLALNQYAHVLNPGNNTSHAFSVDLIHSCVPEMFSRPHNFVALTQIESPTLMGSSSTDSLVIITDNPTPIQNNVNTIPINQSPSSTTATPSRRRFRGKGKKKSIPNDKPLKKRKFIHPTPEFQSIEDQSTPYYPSLQNLEPLEVINPSEEIIGVNSSTTNPSNNITSEFVSNMIAYPRVTQHLLSQGMVIRSLWGGMEWGTDLNNNAVPISPQKPMGELENINLQMQIPVGSIQLLTLPDEEPTVESNIIFPTPSFENLAGGSMTLSCGSLMDVAGSAQTYELLCMIKDISVVAHNRNATLDSNIGHNKGVNHKLGGSGNHATIRQLQLLIKTNNLDIVFLFETKASQQNMSYLVHSLLYPNFFIVPAINTAGGLCLMWKVGLHITISSSSQNNITSSIFTGPNALPWTACFFYGSPYPITRNISWDPIRNLHNNTTPTLIIGDLNIILTAGETTGT